MNDIENTDGREERETVYTMQADDRNVWNAWTNDPVSDRLLRKRGAVVTKEYKSGKQVTARTYRLDGNQISVRNKAKPLTEKQKAARAVQAARLRELNSK